ncbi:MAG: hypothetical protein J1F24_02815 [Oscillospiraceae bacterium]|nr:hypothetical protein [Oscillospiraceae bacterium]
MKKNKGMAYAILGIAFILFNTLAFVIPAEKTLTFWIAYIFTVIAFAVQIGVWKLAFSKAETPKSKFLGLPIIHIGVVYLIAQLIAFAVFMANSALQAWIAVVISVLLLGVSAICLITTEAGRDEINRVEEKVQQKVFYIKALQADVEILAEQETDKDTKTALAKLIEAIRFSDPMSNEILTEVETQIKDKVAELKTAENKSAIITELNLLLAERNKKAKILK